MGILLTYDVTDETSFQSMYSIILYSYIDVRNWMKNIEEHAAENVNKILIGNKCDLVEKKVVDTERAKQLAAEYGLKFLETSAKNNINVEEAFFAITRDIKARLIDSNEPESSNTNTSSTHQGFSLQPNHTKKKTNCCKSQ